MEELPELSDSLENYIEMIYLIILEKNAVRAKEIGKRLKVKGSSVTSALKQLAQKKLINYEPYGIITLTPLGNTAARRVIEKHKILERFFHEILGVEEPEAGESACKVEHTVSRDIVQRLLALSRFIHSLPGNGDKFITDFQAYYDSERKSLECDECLGDFIDGTNEKDTAGTQIAG